MIAPSPYGPRAARPALLPPTWPPFDPETGQFDLSDEAGPPDGFFVDPDIAMRIAEATTIAEGLSPAEAWRDSNRKRSELTHAQWDLDVRRRAYEEAQAFSFTDSADGAEPVFAELSPEDAANLDTFSGRTNLEVDFPPEHGGYFARVSDPVEGTEIGRFPRKLVLNLAQDVADTGTADEAAGSEMSRLKRDSDDDDGWLSRYMTGERIRDFVLDFIPGVGHYRAGRDAIESYSEAIEAARREDWDAFLKHGGMGLLNTLGVFAGPLGAPLVRIVRMGLRQLADTTPGVKKIVAARGLNKSRKRADKPYKSRPVDKVLGKAFDELTDAQKRTVRGIFPNVIGKAGEGHARKQLKNAGQEAKGQTTMTTKMGGETMRRRYDASIEEVKHDFIVDAFKIFDPNAKSVAVEVKMLGSRSSRQNKIDRAVEADGSSAQQVLRLRYPIKAIDEKDFKRMVSTMFSKHVSDKPGGLSKKQADRIVGRLMRLRRGYGDWVNADLAIGIAAREYANVLTWEREDRQRKERGYWDTVSELATGA